MNLYRQEDTFNPEYAIISCNFFSENIYSHQLTLYAITLFMKKLGMNSIPLS